MIGQQIRTARTTRGLSLRALARLVPMNPGYLSQIENGTRKPSRSVVDRLGEILGTELVLPNPIPATAGKLSGETPAVLSQILAGQRRLEDAVGSGPLLVPTLAELHVVKGLVRAARGPLRRELLDVGTQWATFAGWLGTATGRHAESERAFAVAADWAAETADDTLGSHVYSFKGYAAGRCGDLAAMEGLTAAARRFRRTHPGQQAYNCFQHARVLARLGNRRQAAHLLDQAVREADTAGHEGEPPAYAYWYTPAFFKLNVGLTHAWLGNHHEAHDLITDGLAELPDEQRASEWADEFRTALVA